MGGEGQMQKVTIALKNGRHVTFDVDLGLEGPAFFVFGIRKSGSTLLNIIAAEMCRSNGRMFVNVGDKFFQGNVLAVDWQTDRALHALLHPGNTYGGFRNMPLAMLKNPLFESSPKVLIVRDPRDALVSEYFSDAYSHPIPSASSDSSDTATLMERHRQRALREGIDGYVLERAQSMVRTILEFRDVVNDPTTKVLKYEDYVFNKRELINVMAQHFSWSADENSIAAILNRVDIRPAKEDPQAFVRRVTPGDHREKLQPSTIATLDVVLLGAMRLMGYSEGG